MLIFSTKTVDGAIAVISSLYWIRKKKVMVVVLNEESRHCQLLQFILRDVCPPVLQYRLTWTDHRLTLLSQEQGLPDILERVTRFQ